MTEIRDRDRGWKKLGRMLKKQSFRRPHVNVGVLGPEATAAHAHGELTVVEVASFHEFGRGNNPERSFIRATVDGNSSKYVQLVRKLAADVVAGRITEKRALEVIGQRVESDIKTRIEDGIPPPLAEVTIARKGSSKQLIDTSQMKNSVTYITGDV